METTLEEGEGIEEAVDVRQDNMPGGKSVALDLMKRAMVPKRAAEDQKGASGPRPNTP